MCRLAGHQERLPLQIYEPFAADFGPLNLGSTFRFCQKAMSLLQVEAFMVSKARAARIIVN